MNRNCSPLGGKSWRVIVTALLVSSLGVVACGGPKGPLHVPLKYEPTSNVELVGISGELVTTPLSIGRIKDGRSGDPSILGNNVEDKEKVIVRADPKKILATVEHGIHQVFKESGLNVSPGASTEVNIELKRLWVEEGNTYKAEARLLATVTKEGVKTGQLLVGGSSSRWGSSLEPEEYTQAASDAVLEACVTLLNMPDFAKAVSGTASASSPSDLSSDSEHPGVD